jgi:hypothetical protein
VKFVFLCPELIGQEGTNFTGNFTITGEFVVHVLSGFTSEFGTVIDRKLAQFGILCCQQSFNKFVFALNW